MKVNINKQVAYTIICKVEDVRESISDDKRFIVILCHKMKTKKNKHPLQFNNFAGRFIIHGDSMSDGMGGKLFESLERLSRHDTIQVRIEPDGTDSTVISLHRISSLCYTY